MAKSNSTMAQQIAEAAIAFEAMKLGIGVFRPMGDERYDLIFDTRPSLLRVQCKWATRYGEVVVVRCYSCRRAREGLRSTLILMAVISGSLLGLSFLVLLVGNRRREV